MNFADNIPTIDMSHVPDGRCGTWYIESFSVTPMDCITFNDPNVNHLMRPITPGTYKRLVTVDPDGSLATMMSNTPAEIDDFMKWARDARGHILINGLGLGVLVTYLLTRPEVESITVIENSKDVIQLVAGCFDDPRLRVIYGDAFEWYPEPGDRNRWDIVWHDIWLYISPENLGEMDELEQRYEGRCDLQISWCRQECEDRLDYERGMMAAIKAARELHREQFAELLKNAQIYAEV